MNNTINELYIISQKDPLVTVCHNNQLWLEVKQRYALRYVYSDFYKEGKLFLTSSFKRTLFGLKIEILEQDTQEHLLLEKVRGKFELEAGRYRISMGGNHFKNPLYTFLNNGEQIGEVSSKLFSVGEFPVFNCSFYSNSDANFYAILLFLIRMKPTMETF